MYRTLGNERIKKEQNRIASMVLGIGKKNKEAVINSIISTRRQWNNFAESNKFRIVYQVKISYAYR